MHSPNVHPLTGMARAQVSGLAHVRLAKLSYFVAVGWSRTVWMWPDREAGR